MAITVRGVDHPKDKVTDESVTSTLRDAFHLAELRKAAKKKKAQKQEDEYWPDEETPPVKIVIEETEAKQVESKSEPTEPVIEPTINVIEDNEKSIINNKSAKYADPVKQNFKEAPMSNVFGVSYNTSSSEELEKFVENITLDVKTQSPAARLNAKVELINNSSLHCPVVAITEKDSDGKYRSVLLLIEKHAKPIHAQTVKEGDRTVEITRTLNHAYNQSMRNVVSQHLAAKGVENVSYIGYFVIFNNLSLESKRTSGIYSISSLLALANQTSNLGALPLAEEIKNGKELINYIKIQPGVTDHDVLGMPVASDVTSEVILRKKQTQGAQSQLTELNDGESENQVLKVNAIIDALFINPKTIQSRSGMQNIVVRNKAAIIATNIEGLNNNSTGVYESKGSILLALSSLAPLAADGNYRQIFNKGGRGCDKAPVGVVGLYGNCDPNARQPAGEIKVAETQDRATDKLVGPLDVFDDYFDLTELPVIGFDAIEGSRMSWAMRDFITAAKGETSIERTAAERRILKAVDEQGDGSFSKKWGDKRIVKRLGVIHYGIVQNTDGSQVSLQSFDNFQAMAAAKGDMSLLSKIAINGPEISTRTENLDERLKFYRELMNVDVKLYGDRLYFDPEFMVAYVKYLIDCKVNIRPEGIIDTFDATMSSGIDTTGFAKNFDGMFTRGNSFDTAGGSGFNFAFS